MRTLLVRYCSIWLAAREAICRLPSSTDARVPTRSEPIDTTP
jgi:hypothetical protein